MAEGFPSSSATGEDEPPSPPEGELAAERSVIAAASPLAGSPSESESETTEAGQEAPLGNGLASSMPTQRPELPRSSPFAGLLAEAGVRASEAPPRPHPDTAPRPRPSAAPPPAAAAPPAELPPAAPSTGRSLGAYRVLGELGSGGMAIVYKALQPSLDRLVAIKELRQEFVSDRQICARFEREATSLATLQHGNIVHIYDFIRDVDTAYIVMEYVEGTDLFDVLHDARGLPPDVAAVIALQLAEGLEYAHYHGIIHRDVKPSNLLISKLGEVKIMDFGIARDHGRADLTQVGMSLGTPAYMAPEQIRGDKVDFRADIFGLGIVLYEMLSGHKPWGDDESSTNIARKVLYEEMTPIRQHCPDLPAALAQIIESCLAKEPDRRYPSTHDLRRALAAYLAEEVAIDPRQRLVVFLRNRGQITEGEATSFVHSSVLYDGVLRRRDLGLPSVEPRALVRPLLKVSGAVLLALIAALVLGLWAPIEGLERLPPERPTLQLVPPESSRDAASPSKAKKKRSGGTRSSRRE
ncbi:MAG: serine/threonine protein kinase [Deltaproteobacteria bacterium]|nr:serine/threonine protein kinase [Deltaproteobacteria bacterium]